MVAKGLQDCGRLTDYLREAADCPIVHNPEREACDTLILASIASKMRKACVARCADWDVRAPSVTLTMGLQLNQSMNISRRHLGSWFAALC